MTTSSLIPTGTNENSTNGISKKRRRSRRRANQSNRDLKPLDTNAFASGRSDDIDILLEDGEVRETNMVSNGNAWTRQNIPKNLIKYFNQRYSLFSKFDEGIQLDEESWYSVTPEDVARHIANRTQCGTIVDAMCGVGGNSIQFAMLCQKVIAIDHDPIKIEMAKVNARVYGVADKIEFIVGDAFEVLPSLKADVVYTSPPWGGPAYLDAETLDIEHLSVDMTKFYAMAKQITPHVAMYLPRNVNPESIAALTAEKEIAIELELVCLNGRPKAMMVYMGGLVMAE
ncbi:hypothetical protein SmJEL517_g05794 [Synchytrium microbalum]|uniref:Trimethylguanosine synthase n=1 Tax=Synchytrium microbalum TaxID=1806994 RepID=A0A507BY23_9FUNG|nr:uncharacterized protein SmJEL517_g05794 [Synchytrium microbalum]TPX30704.1 hypothetical protein SmJEL517_g05794 [Synchytrium microbalum]